MRWTFSLLLCSTPSVRTGRPRGLIDLIDRRLYTFDTRGRHISWIGQSSHVQLFYRGLFSIVCATVTGLLLALRLACTPESIQNIPTTGQKHGYRCIIVYGTNLRALVLSTTFSTSRNGQCLSCMNAAAWRVVRGRQFQVVLRASCFVAYLLSCIRPSAICHAGSACSMYFLSLRRRPRGADVNLCISASLALSATTDDAERRLCDVAAVATTSQLSTSHAHNETR